MKALRLPIQLLALLVACWASSAAITVASAAELPVPADKAADESAAPEADGESSPAPAAAQAQRGTKTEEAEEQQAAARRKASAKGGSPERFVPSEQVRADFDVSFPIDI